MSQEITAKEVTAALLTVATIGVTIRDLGRVPNGHLYSQVMSHMSNRTYNKCLDLLKQGNLIKEENNVLIWIGPLKEG
jgi:hypothetical protein